MTKPLMTKPTKWHVRPAKPQISLDIRQAVLSVFAVRSMASWGPNVSSCGQRWLWSDAKSDLSLRWTHGFVMRRLIWYNYCPCVRITWGFVHPRQVILPEGNITCRGWTNRHVTLTQGQQLFYYTDLFYYFFQSVEKLKLPRFICSHIYNRCFW